MTAKRESALSRGGWRKRMVEALRAKVSQRMPVVLGQDEAFRLLAAMEGMPGRRVRLMRWGAEKQKAAGG